MFLSFSLSLSAIKQPTFETAWRSCVHTKLREQIKWRKYSKGGNSSPGSDSGAIRSFAVGSAAFFSFFFPPRSSQLQVKTPGHDFCLDSDCFWPQLLRRCSGSKGRTANEKRKSHESKLSSSTVRRFFLRNTSVFCLCGAAQF